ncbi:hypothetical protein RJP21_13555 [Paenibacillus sp. VCA1]|uniref:hypothetical protein n=1 Tax=Paenibacillus sp. VCA1 TaxID=3039148 RepID=UPI002872899B|nr:hypothetical protein [Paenibacillus sp. VCA1]MDR9854635.1 hypothetical protein [Paenibacillus sp. VCA1]
MDSEPELVKAGTCPFVKRTRETAVPKPDFRKRLNEFLFSGAPDKVPESASMPLHHYAGLF